MASLLINIEVYEGSVGINKLGWANEKKADKF